MRGKIARPGLYVGHWIRGPPEKWAVQKDQHMVRFGPDCIWSIGPPVCCLRERTQTRWPASREGKLDNESLEVRSAGGTHWAFAGRKWL